MESARRLGEALHPVTPDGDSISPGYSNLRYFADRAPNWAWSEAMWRWALETGAAHALFLQDDVIPAPNFWPALTAMLAAAPDKVIGLEQAHPAGKRLALEGHRWMTTSDMLIGPGYVFPRTELAEFLKWRRDALRPGAVENIPEDTLIGVWSLATGRRLWHPIPTIIDHDTSIESTYGNGAHANRRPTVTWRDGDVVGFAAEDLEDAEWWRRINVVDRATVTIRDNHLGRFYAATPHLARMWLRDCPDALLERMLADECPAAYRRWMT